MKFFLNKLGIGLAGLVVLILIFAMVVRVSVNSRANKTYDVTVASIEVPSDAESIARGEHVFITATCVDCHGDNLAGGIFIDDPAIGKLYAANLTSGEGGRGAIYSDDDFVRAIRHGINQQNQSVYFMEVRLYWYLNDADMGDLLAYMRSVEPVDGTYPEPALSPLGYFLTFIGQISMFPAEVVDHEVARPTVVDAGATKEYGAYLAFTCQSCHNPAFSGGVIPGAPPDFLEARNLTPSGELKDWNLEDFKLAMTTGVTPSGRELEFNPAPWISIPWITFAEHTDTDYEAIFLYLQSLPAKEYGEQ